MSNALNRTFSSLSIYNYRVFWLGQLISVSGTWMQTTAQAWLVLKLTNSPTALGTVTLLQFLPITLLAMFGGVFADRLPKRAVLFGTQSASAVQALTLATLVLSGRIQLWELYILALILGLINAFDNPTRQAFVVELVGKGQVANAVALNSSLFNSARIIGPAIGGVAINLAGVGGAFLINGLSYGAVLVGLALMRRDKLYPAPPPRRGHVLSQVTEGVRYAAGTPQVLLVLLLMAVLGTFGYNFSTVLPLIDRYVLHADALILGFLLAAMGAGSLVAALWVAYARRTSQTTLFIGASIFSVVLLLVGLSTWLPLTLVLLVILGFASITFTSTANTRLQLLVPDALRGRVMSLYFLCFAGTTPIGGMLTGVLAGRLGVQPTVLILALICMCGVVGAALYRRATIAPAPGGEGASVESASEDGRAGRLSQPAPPLARPRDAHGGR